MENNLLGSELKVLEILWEAGDSTAKVIADTAKMRIGWSKTTTYTIIKRCIDKGVIERRNPNFLCHPLVTREQAQTAETTILINKLYNGSTDQLIASLIDNKKLTIDEIEHLKKIVGELG